MSARIHVDDSQLEAEFDRLLNIAPAIDACEAVLARQFAVGNAVTHVITGSLRGSQDIDSDEVAGRWSGEISWGGASPGFVNDPVVYAIYEAAREGLHNFRAPLLGYSRQYGRIMHRHVSRRP